MNDVLLDAGPSLNFLAVGQENILIQAAAAWQAQLAAPEQVDNEIRRLCRSDSRFRATGAPGTWRRLTATGRVEIRHDDLGLAAFTAAVSRVSGKPVAQRVRSPASLGEIMVVAHASAVAQSGSKAIVLLDDSDGRARARREQQWLTEQGFVAFTLVDTPQVLRAAKANPTWVTGTSSIQTIYNDMCAFDDGLPRGFTV